MSPKQAKRAKYGVLLVLGLILLIVLIIVLTVLAKRRGHMQDEDDEEETTTIRTVSRKHPPHNFTVLEGDTTTDLFSLNYPGKYPENITFTWYVSAPDGYNILIHFKNLSLEDEYDYLYIGSGRVQLYPGTMFQTLTGFENPVDIFFPGNELYIHLNSDPYESHYGFWMQLTTFKGGDNFTCPVGTSMCKYSRSCFIEEDRCDGVLRCADGTDEVGCKCPDPWYERCGDGHCLVRTQICNRKVACMDDEVNCTFVCNNGNKIRPSYVCDGFNDCIDNSDEEQNCVCLPFQYACTDGKCIHTNNKCNGVAECTDGEDEEDCTCASWQFQCPNSTCIPGWLTCDGSDDCSDGSDEQNCPACPGRYHQCTDKRCISLDKLCDGTPDCANDEDEQNCETTCDPGQVTCPDGTCAVNISSCSVTTTTNMPTTTPMPTTTRPPSTAVHALMSTEAKSTITKAPVICEDSGFACNDGKCIKQEYRCDVIKDCDEGEDEDSCTDIKNSCDGFESTDRFVCDGRMDCPDGSDEDNCPCGDRPIMDANVIMGFAVTTRGKWPWHAGVISSSKSPYCGGTLINRKWVLTAGHCVVGLRNGKVYLGITNWKTGREDGQTIPVERIWVHPNYTGGPAYQNDLGIMKLKEPATLNNFVQPACLPPRGYVIPDGSYVTATGWGSIVESSATPPDLQEVRLPTVPLEYCRNHYSLELLDSVVCAGYSNGYTSTCFGDSGGPLVSFINGTWYSIGSVSAGESCGGPYRPNIFTGTASNLDYILKIMQEN
nr:suppressor of tumorigenicity 14 protein homolog [Lytechinus pictus]